MRIASLCFLAAASAASPGLAAPAEVTTYRGLCEASAAANLDATHFAVASDETNVLQIYERGKPEPVGEADLTGFTGHDKSDLEGAAAIGPRIYWISSHSFNQSGEDKKKRKILFATESVSGTGAPTLKGLGTPFGALRDALAAAAHVAPAELNVEGLAEGPGGSLYIGLRGPLRDGTALVVPLKNPAELVEKGATPEFAEPIPLKLAGMGIRSLERIGTGAQAYLIVAGPVSDATSGFALYSWAGDRSDPAPINGVSFDGLTPEALIAIPGSQSEQILSDDGKVRGEVCDEEGPKEKRHFRSIDLAPLAP